jgi:hypothetical protein
MATTDCSRFVNRGDRRTTRLLNLALPEMITTGLEGEETPPRSSDITQRTVECVQRLAESLRKYPRFGGLPADDPQALELKQCITEFVRAIRAAGSTPEAAVVLTKEMMIQHLLVDDDTWRAITDDVVRWAIDAYF